MAELAVAAIPAVITAAGSYAMSREQKSMQEKMAAKQEDAQRQSMQFLMPTQPDAQLATAEAFAPPPPTLVSPLLKGDAKSVVESPASTGLAQEPDDQYKKLLQGQAAGGMGV